MHPVQAYGNPDEGVYAGKAGQESRVSRVSIRSVTRSKKQHATP